MKKLIEKIKGVFKGKTPNAYVMGVSFQPYVGPWDGGQPVLWNTYTGAQVTKLLGVVAKSMKDKAISTYGQGTFVWQGVPKIQDSNQFNIHAAALNKLKVAAGCALQGISGDSFNVDWSKCEVDWAIKEAKAFGNVVNLVIGNESIFGPVSTGQLIQLINYAKDKVKAEKLNIPVTTRQRWDVMAGVNNTTPGYAAMRQALLDLVSVCDGFIYVDMYPYFDPGIAGAIGGPTANQAQFTTAVQSSMTATWTALTTAWSAQSLTAGLKLGETGWPTSGSQPGQPAAWLATPTFAQWYYQAISGWMTQNTVYGFIFEAYDEPWKGVADGSNSEGHFGIWTANGTSSGVGQYTLVGETQKYSV
jgi:exo-beta-1,3-glucanase (GH17 family)